MSARIKFQLVTIIIFIFIYPLSGNAQGTIDVPERHGLLTKRVSDLNKILDSKMADDHFEISFNPLSLSYFNTSECKVEFDLSKRIHFYNHFDRYSFGNDYLAFRNTGEAVFSSTCSDINSSTLKFNFYTSLIKKLFEAASKDLLSMLYDESYKEGDINVSMRNIENKVKEHKIREQEVLAAIERRKARHFEVNDQNKKKLAFERIEELNKVIKDHSLQKSTYYKLNFEELSIVEYDSKKVDYRRIINLSADMYTIHEKIKSSRYSSRIESLLSFNRLGDVFVVNNYAIEHNSRCIELLQILFGEKKKFTGKGVDWDLLSTHPQLKFLGKSLNDPAINALYTGKKTSKFFGVPFHSAANSDVKRSYLCVYDKETKIIIEVRFILIDYEKVRQYEDLKQLPVNIRGVDIFQEEHYSINYIVYKINPESTAELNVLAFEKEAKETLEKRKSTGEKRLINSYKDFKRFADPKGDDIWTLLANYDPLFVKYLDNNHRSYKGWYDLNYINFSYSGGKYKIKDYNVKPPQLSKLEVRVPFDFEMSFELEKFIPQIMSLPEFVSARYAKIEKRNSSNVRTGKFHYLIELKIIKDSRERHLIIWKDTNDKDGHFEELIISTQESGKTYIDTKFTSFSLNNNPWVEHLETIATVEKEKLETYHKQINELFAYMENDFKTIPLANSTIIESSKQRKIYFNTGFAVSEATKNTLVLNTNGANMHITIMEGDDLKDELYTALTYLPVESEYTTTPGGYEHEGMFGRCLLVRKNKTIIGILKFDFTEEGWRMKAISCNQKKFKESLSSILEQYSVDQFDSWKTPLKEGAFRSKVNLYNSSMSAIYSVEANEKEFIFAGIYAHDEGFVLESLLAEMGALDNFRSDKSGGFVRILKLEIKGIDYYIRFTPSPEKLHSINIYCGGDYKNITRLNIGVQSLNAFSQNMVLATENAGLDLIWSDIGTRSLTMTIPAERWGNESKIILEKGYIYALTIIYKNSENTPKLNAYFRFDDGGDNIAVPQETFEYGNFSSTSVSFPSMLDKGVLSVQLNALFKTREEEAIMNVYLFKMKEKKD